MIGTHRGYYEHVLRETFYGTTAHINLFLSYVCTSVNCFSCQGNRPSRLIFPPLVTIRQARMSIDVEHHVPTEVPASPHPRSPCAIAAM